MKDVHRKFSGSIPENYARYLVPLLFAPYADDLVRRLAQKPKMSVLELACGTGVVTRRLADVLRSDSTIVATDLNQGMIDVARASLPNDARINWMPADATNLPFGDAEFDAVLCQFGWMFFPDKARAMREARRVLRPGGQLLFNTWDRLSRNVVLAETDDEIRSRFPQNPPTFYRAPFSMFDPAEHMRLARGAGFSKIEVVPVALAGIALAPHDVAIGVVCGNPTSIEIAERGGDVAAVVTAVTARLAARFGDAPFAAPMNALVCTALAT